MSSKKALTDLQKSDEATGGAGPTAEPTKQYHYVDGNNIPQIMQVDNDIYNMHQSDADIHTMHQRDALFTRPSIPETELTNYLKTFDEYYSIADYYYKKHEWITIPIRFKIEKEEIRLAYPIRWSTINKDTPIKEVWYGKIVEKREDDFVKKEKIKTTTGIDQTYTCGLALLCGDMSNVVVLDIDNIEEFEKQSNIKIENLLGTTLTAITKSNGLHLFYKYDPELSQTIHAKGFDLQSDKALINLPPTIGPSKNAKSFGQYEWLYDVEIAEMPKELKEFLLSLNKQYKEEAEKNRNKTYEVLQWIPEDIEKLAKHLRSLYEKKHISGYFVDCELIGGLIDLNFKDEIIKNIVEYIFGCEYNERLTQYLIDRTRSIKDNHGTYRGLGSFLKELISLSTKGITEASELYQLTKTHIYEEEYKEIPNLIGYETDETETYLYKLKKRENTYIRVLVGPYIRPLKTLRGSRAYMIYEFQGKEKQAYFTDPQTFLNTIRSQTGIAILKPQDFNEYLENYKMANNVEYEDVIDSYGWEDDEKTFRHPAITEGYYKLLPNYDKMLLSNNDNNKEKHFEFVKKVLNSDGYLNILFLASFSAPILRFGGNSFTINVSGKPQTGKTLASTLACNLFYDNREPLSLRATLNANESIIAKFSDLPILLDERELTATEEETIKLIYMIFSNQTKRRLDINLNMNFKKFKSVAFNTGEHTLEDMLTKFLKKSRNYKAGALRRGLNINIPENQPWIEIWGISKEEMIQARNLYGYVGVEWIKWLLANKDKVLDAKYKASSINNNYPSGMEQIYEALYTTIYLLEEFFGMKINTKPLERYTMKEVKPLIEDQIVNRERIWIQKLINWLKQNERAHFIHLEESPFTKKEEPTKPSHDFWGSLVWEKDDRNIIQITTTAFESFCLENDINIKDFLDALYQAEAIFKNNKRYAHLYSATAKDLGSKTRPYVYLIDLDKLYDVLMKYEEKEKLENIQEQVENKLKDIENIVIKDAYEIVEDKETEQAIKQIEKELLHLKEKANIQIDFEKLTIKQAIEIMQEHLKNSS